MYSQGDETIKDAVIIGGGPAGATSAALLASWGHDVVLITRSRNKRPLAESLPPSCSKLFDQFGVSSAIAAGGFVRSTGNTVWWGSDESRVEIWPADRLGYQVRRDTLDGILLDWAEAAGAHVLRNALVRDVRALDSSELTVQYEITGDARTVRTGRVLDCTGRSGLFARRGMRRAESAAKTIALVAYWERRAGWDLDHASHTLVESYPGGWAWSVPVTPEQRCIAVMLDPTVTRLGGRHRLAGLYREELVRTRQFSRLLEGATPLSDAWACDASPYSAHCVADRGVLLAGDAASFVDPLSSFGVKKALASAWLAAVVTHTCLEQPEMEPAAIELYTMRERAMYESLQQQYAAFSREAVSAHSRGFWEERATLETEAVTGEPDVAALRTDADVLHAFETLKRADALRLQRSPGLERRKRPVVRGRRIALADHLVCTSFPHGIRWLRDVDLVKLVELAGTCDQVPDLFDAYNESSPPVALPDFLGALSVLLGKGVLTNP
jgi:flavin-dependent dehydrogenase